MKKTITAVAALLFTAATFAQSATTPAATPAARPVQEHRAPQANHPRETPEQRAHQEVDEMTKVLGLNADMSAKVLAIQTDFITKRDAVRGNEKKGEMTPDQKSQIEKLKQDRKAQMEQALGKDQMKKWHDYKKGNEGKNHEGHEGPHEGHDAQQAHPADKK